MYVEGSLFKALEIQSSEEITDVAAELTYFPTVKKWEVQRRATIAVIY